MNIRVKLYALLDKYLPPGTSKGAAPDASRGATGNEADLDVADGATVSAVLDGLGLPPEVCHLVLINGNFVAPGERKTKKLAEGDHLAVWPPVAGGGGKKKAAGGGPKPITVEKEMAVTHADFFRTLPRALGTNGFKKSGDKVVLEDGEMRLEIALGPEGERKIAQLSVPATQVTLTFSGYTDTAAADALKLFDRMFQKGGG